jgi:hypothetical protein
VTIFTGARLVEFLASVIAAFAAHAVRAWWKRAHAPTVDPVSAETRARLDEDDTNNPADFL